MDAAVEELRNQDFNREVPCLFAHSSYVVGYRKTLRRKAAGPKRFQGLIYLQPHVPQKWIQSVSFFLHPSAKS